MIQADGFQAPDRQTWSDRNSIALVCFAEGKLASDQIKTMHVFLNESEKK